MRKMKKLIGICVVMILLSMGYARAGTWTTIDKPGIRHTYLQGISGNNIIGFYPSGGILDPYLWFIYNFKTKSWTYISKPGAPNIWIEGIDGSNLVGSYSDASGGHGFFYNGATWTTINKPGATDTSLTGISGNNTVGTYTTSVSLQVIR
jgi:hypothetical protein